MAAASIFICHARTDAAFAQDLRIGLETFRLAVWQDVGNSRGEDRLAAEVRWAIEQARQIIVVLSLNTDKPTWLRREIELAQEVERRRGGSYRVIPLLLPGVDHRLLGQWFIPLPRTAPLQLPAEGLAPILPALLATLGEPPPGQMLQSRSTQSAAELEFSFRKASTPEGSWYWSIHSNPQSEQASDTAQTASGRLPVMLPQRLQHWYLQTYPCWPTELLRRFADDVATQLVDWGHSLYQMFIEATDAPARMATWHKDPSLSEYRLVIRTEPPAAAAAPIFNLPWELLHDSTDFLIKGKRPIQFIRQLAGGGNAFAPVPPPLRVLAINPRPETELIGHLDYRHGTLPLLEGLASLGGLVALHKVRPTFTALEKQLHEAQTAGRPFLALHLDSHLYHDPHDSTLSCAFEAHQDLSFSSCREGHFIQATILASLLAAHCIRLVVLYKSPGKAVDRATVELAGVLLAAGITAVVTVDADASKEAQQQFWAAFYEELLRGSRISQAMLAGQHQLASDSYRAPGLSGGINLRDWFCFQLYLGEQDPAFCWRPPLELRRRLLELPKTSALGRLPSLPPTGFVGRARDLLRLERLLEEQPKLFIRGVGGCGKTTTAIALAQWLAGLGRFYRIAYVTRTDISDPRSLLEILGRQLTSQGVHWSVDAYSTLWRALDQLRQAIQKQPTLIILDHLDWWPAEHNKLFDQLWQDLLQQCAELRLLGLGRLGPPSFAQPWKEIKLAPVDECDAICLLGQTLLVTREIPPISDRHDGFQPLSKLAQLAGGHPVALQRIAHEIAQHGAKATLTLVRTLRIELLRRHANDPQWPFFLSIELSLRQLLPEDREYLNILAFFKEGANRIALRKALRLDTSALDAFQERLRALQLIEDSGYGHWRFDPALAQYLANQLTAEQRTTWQAHWRNGMEVLVDALYEQHFKDPARTARLLRLELPNLLTFLRDYRQHFSPERTAHLAARLEQLLASLGIPSALNEVIAARERASHALSGWSHLRFETERLRVERLRDNGSLEEAIEAAQQLLSQCQTAGSESYPGARYDLAHAYFQLGKLLKLNGVAKQAIQEFSAARKHFHSLAKAGNANAERIAVVIDAEMGDCLTYLQSLQEAASAYEAAIAQAGPNTPQPMIATNKMQLGLVRQRQGAYPEAVALYDDARRLFEALGEAKETARAWQQLVLAYKLNGEMDLALHAGQQALYLYEQQRYRTGILEALGELGSLYQVLNQLDEAVLAYRRLSEMHAQSGDGLGEEASRNKLANVLIQLHRHDEARQELFRASECNLPDSYTARNWAIRRGLHDVGQNVQNPDIAEQARRQAIQKYLAYRKAGGENNNPGARLCAQVRYAIRAGEAESFAAKLAQLAANSNIPAEGKILIEKLQAILAGSRDPALSTDQNLHYQYAVELQLLLENLAH